MRFNTSHVTLYQPETCSNFQRLRVSIHHMLLFISIIKICSRKLDNVSIHHMLLFISFGVIAPRSTIDVSIHHMLLFISGSGLCGAAAYWFQYITCYSLSDLLSQILHGYRQFQYITCYSLSGTCPSWSRNLWSFQYITCYSLSLVPDPFLCFWHVSIHHMLLFISGHRSGPSLLPHVSIHHMLLFINIWRHRLKCLWGFQYITCYSLSTFSATSKPRSGVSIHHMLLFIPRFIGILSIHMSNNTPKPKEFQYFYQALLEILYF